MQNSSFIVPNILQDIEQIIYDIITHYIEHVVNALQSGKFNAEVITFLKLCNFLQRRGNLFSITNVTNILELPLQDGSTFLLSMWE